MHQVECTDHPNFLRYATTKEEAQVALLMHWFDQHRERRATRTTEETGEADHYGVDSPMFEDDWCDERPYA